MKKLRVAVVIPMFKVRNQIISVLERIGDEVDFIYVIDDKCPEESGKLVEEWGKDFRVQVLYNELNLGVGGATKRGYEACLNDGIDIVIKLDGDAQMDPSLIPKLLAPIQEGRADYCKGNRFFNIEKIREMPFTRIIGNLFLSFYSKTSTGYWQIFDPNNGFTAISAIALNQMPLKKVSDRYFFESDMLFRLNSIRAVVKDVPMDAVYGHEKSNLSPFKSVFEFSIKHFRNFLKRVFYNYFLREFSFASLQLLFGSVLLGFSVIHGFVSWENSHTVGTATQPGTLILITLSFLTGLQLILGFLAYDMSNTPDEPLSSRY